MQWESDLFILYICVIIVNINCNYLNFLKQLSICVTSQLVFSFKHLCLLRNEDFLETVHKVLGVYIV